MKFNIPPNQRMVYDPKTAKPKLEGERCLVLKGPCREDVDIGVACPQK